MFTPPKREPKKSNGNTKGLLTFKINDDIRDDFYKLKEKNNLTVDMLLNEMVKYSLEQYKKTLSL